MPITDMKQIRIMFRYPPMAEEDCKKFRDELRKKLVRELTCAHKIEKWGQAIGEYELHDTTGPDNLLYIRFQCRKEATVGDNQQLAELVQKYAIGLLEGRGCTNVQ